ncbi:MAG: hypothetical protein ACLQPN_12290 [Bryobacteraceae bacterium]
MGKLLLLILPVALLPAQSIQPMDGGPGLMAMRNASLRLPKIPAKPVATTVAHDMVFPRIICGSGWSTTLVLVNAGSSSADFQLAFSGADGESSQFVVTTQPDIGTLTTSGLQGTLGPSSSLSLALTSGSQLQEGWGLLSSSGSPNTIGGYAIIRHSGLGGAFSFETTVPLSNMQDYSLYVPFDNTLGFQTQLTIVNPASNLGAQVALTYRTPEGQVLLIDSVDLGAGQQMTIVLPNEYPDLANTSGTINIEANIDVLSATAVRYNPAYGTIAAVPGMN